MEYIVDPTDAFDFSALSLAHPSGIQGGAYFTKILNNMKPMYIKSDRSLMKQGFVKSGKRTHCDLMFDQNASNTIQWFERLEERCQQLLLTKSNDWFQDSLDANDVETAFTSPIRIYKSGKYYLLRTNVKTDSTGEPVIKIYDERAQTLERVDADAFMVSVLEIQGIKFTTRTFQIEIELKQVMVIDKDPEFDKCVINVTKHKVKNSVVEHSVVEHSVVKDSVMEDLGINLGIEHLNIENLDNDDIKEIEPVDIPVSSETITLKKPNQLYIEMYKEARIKAKQAKKTAIVAYLEAKNIRKLSMLEFSDDSDFDAEIDEASESDLELF